MYTKVILHSTYGLLDEIPPYLFILISGVSHFLPKDAHSFAEKNPFRVERDSCGDVSILLFVD